MQAAVRPRWGLWRQGLLALLLSLVIPGAAHAQTFPKFTNLVVDRADVIPPDAERRLDRKLADLQRRTGHQLAVVTVQSLEGRDVDDYARRLANLWGIGRKQYNDGVLLLVAPSEHRVRISVGYGLEATLTDPRCAEIIRDRILPRFKQQDLPGGIAAGVDAIVVRLDAAPFQKPRAS